MTNFNKFQSLLALLSISILVGCKVYNSKTIYKSDNNNNYWTVQVLNDDNCKCSQLYVVHFIDKKIDFRIFYTDSLVRKTVYTPPKYSQTNSVDVYLTTDKDNYSKSLDSLDQLIFTTIESLNKSNSNIKFKLKDKIIKGYNLDPKYK